jgi:hypothetical protein
VGQAVAAQLLCACYLQFIEWVPVFPWNDLANGNQQEMLDGILAVAQLAFAAGFAFRRRWLMAPALVGYAAWLALQLHSWWTPYLLGGRTVGPRWYFARTFKFLPIIDHRPTPDAAHIVLQITLVLVLVTGNVAWRAVTNAARQLPEKVA